MLATIMPLTIRFVKPVLSSTSRLTAYAPAWLNECSTTGPEPEEKPKGSLKSQNQFRIEPSGSKLLVALKVTVSPATGVTGEKVKFAIGGTSVIDTET